MQERSFFNDYYGCYCYLPLYVFYSEDTVQELERIVGQIRAVWPHVALILRAESGFAREDIMRWSEPHRVDYVLGLAKTGANPGFIVTSLPVEDYDARSLYEVPTVPEATRRTASRNGCCTCSPTAPAPPGHSVDLNPSSGRGLIGWEIRVSSSLRQVR